MTVVVQCRRRSPPMILHIFFPGPAAFFLQDDDPRQAGRMMIRRHGGKVAILQETYSEMRKRRSLKRVMTASPSGAPSW